MSVHRGKFAPSSLIFTVMVLGMGLWGCDEPIEPPAECAGPGEVELGWGGARLRRLADGQDLPIVEGGQGGIHVLVGFWPSGLDLNLSASYRLEDLNGRTIGIPTDRELSPATFSQRDGRIVRNPDLIVIDNDSQDPTAFSGLQADVVLEVRTATAHACDRRRVTLRPADP